MVAAPNGCAADCGWVLQLLLKFAEPRSWYQEPRLCPPDAANAADCEKPIVGMRVKALQLEDLKVRAVSQIPRPPKHPNAVAPHPRKTRKHDEGRVRRRNGAHGCSRKTQIRRHGWRK